MREAFEILDRDNDGQVTHDDVVDMLTNLGLFSLPPPVPLNLAPIFLFHPSPPPADPLNNMDCSGLPSSPPFLQPFFPSGAPSSLPLATFLSTLSSLLTPLSPSSELLSAFAAFDDDDSGQIDVHELRDALRHTGPMEFNGGTAPAPLSVDEIETVLAGFSGRRAFGGGKGLSGPAKARGDVFRYREFVGSVTGGGGGGVGDGAKGETTAGPL